MRSPTVHQLADVDANNVVGVIDPARPPVLTVASGDQVVLSTRHLWGGAIDATTTVADMRRLREQCLADGALGPHTLTGPIAVSGARPGDALRVDVLELELGPHGYNMILPQAISTGALADRFAEPSIAHYDLTGDRVELAPGLTVEPKPFLGIMGVAPADDGPRSTAPPGPFGGNIDLQDLVVGTSLLLPVFRDDALFYTGDAHALQGDGEVDQTGLEATFRRARLRLSVEPQAGLRLPRALTPTHVIVLAFGPTLDAAAAAAVDEAVDVIAAARGCSAVDAYRLCSLGVDLGVTQMVNVTRGVHARIPRALLGEDDA